MKTQNSIKNPDLSRLVRPNIRKLVPYVAEEVPCKAKLDANESPYPAELDYQALLTIQPNRYPDPQASALKAALAGFLGERLGPEWILHGNGSDELIFNLICVFKGPVIYPVPTFSMYGKIAQALGEKTVEIPLQKNFALDTQAIIKEVSKGPNLVFLSTPNNPTGNAFAPADILRIAEKSRGLVVVDEAYQPFSGQRTFIKEIKKRPNILVMKTLSKIGLAALRLGFLIARPEIIKEVDKVRLPFNVNSFSQAAAVGALGNQRPLNKSIEKVISERKRLFKLLSGIKGLTPFPSKANFILFAVDRHIRIEAAGLCESVFNGAGVLLRHIVIPDGREYVRVTVGTRKENDLFIKAIKRALK